MSLFTLPSSFSLFFSLYFFLFFFLFPFFFDFCVYFVFVEVVVKYGNTQSLIQSIPAQNSAPSRNPIFPTRQVYEKPKHETDRNHLNQHPRQGSPINTICMRAFAERPCAWVANTTHTTHTTCMLLMLLMLLMPNVYTASRAVFRSGPKPAAPRGSSQLAVYRAPISPLRQHFPSRRRRDTVNSRPRDPHLLDQAAAFSHTKSQRLFPLQRTIATTAPHATEHRSTPISSPYPSYSSSDHVPSRKSNETTNIADPER